MVMHACCFAPRLSKPIGLPRFAHASCKLSYFSESSHGYIFEASSASSSFPGSWSTSSNRFLTLRFWSKRRQQHIGGLQMTLEFLDDSENNAHFFRCQPSPSFLVVFSSIEYYKPFKPLL
eukprot:GHVT01048052.1.p2 GENE.GHVT01048052.1~~GHVT01048052.1.p2  ORF type:complete len:120 (+),score=11.70 GHVT01048052.1:234-593(+)